MRILWVCNIMPPIIAKKLHMESSIKEGWISGLLAQMLDEAKEKNLHLAIAFPTAEAMENLHDVYIFNGVSIECFGFYEDLEHPENYDFDLEDRFDAIYNMYQPDIVHIFGSEYGHSVAAVRAARNKDRILLGIQGVISVCAKEYMAGLPENIQKKKSFRDCIKKDGLLEQQKKFEKRGERECKLLRLLKNVTGRTEFDRSFCESINEELCYYPMNETMRSCFYEDEWALTSCEKYQIFFSQADYPLKGFHLMLEAMPKILKEYPDAKIIVAGADIIHKQGPFGFLKVSAYGKYLKKLIEENGLQGKVEFLGKLSAEEMKKAYLDSHVFVCASSVENSPNSVAEAMLLGTPVVAARVGGISSMVTDNKEGLFFEKENVEELAVKVKAVFEDSSFPLSARLSNAAIQRAKRTHNPKLNFNRLLEIYEDIIEKAEK